MMTVDTITVDEKYQLYKYRGEWVCTGKYKATGAGFYSHSIEDLRRVLLAVCKEQTKGDSTGMWMISEMCPPFEMVASGIYKVEEETEK